MTNRHILRLTGPDTRDFLQGLVTNDVEKLSDGLVYAALLTPQGKYMADFFLVPDGDAVLVDVDASLGTMLAQRLNMYKLRAAVEIATVPLHLHRGVGDVPEDGFIDPRSPKMGWRAYRTAPQGSDDVDWDAIRVQQMVPETGAELSPDTFILEADFERLNGVDFRKGCYVGQEVTARMKHKTDLRKGLAPVIVSGSAEVGTPLTSNGKAVGKLFTQSGGKGIAYLRFDRADGEMVAGTAKVTWALSKE
ncbi:MAG: folate-binding protein [Sulfitobacter sp.]